MGSDELPPEPLHRKRKLSISPNSTDPEPLKTSSQHQSIFFKFPAEIRLKVYGELIGKRELLHIDSVDGFPSAYRCPEPSRHQNLDLPSHMCWAKAGNNKPKPKALDAIQQPGLGILGLLKSCRRVYSEFIEHLYSTPTLVFHDYESFFALAI